MISLRQIFKLFKSAAEDIAAFYPEWVKEHPELKKLKLLTDVKKEIPVPDYREPVATDISFIFENDNTKKNVIEQLITNELDPLVTKALDALTRKVIRNIELEIQYTESDIADLLHQESETTSTSEAESSAPIEPNPISVTIEELKSKLAELHEALNLANSFYTGLVEINSSINDLEIIKKIKVTNKISKALVLKDDVKFVIGRDTIFSPKDTYLVTAFKVFCRKVEHFINTKPVLTEYKTLLYCHLLNN